MIQFYSLTSTSCIQDWNLGHPKSWIPWLLKLFVRQEQIYQCVPERPRLNISPQRSVWLVLELSNELHRAVGVWGFIFPDSSTSKPVCGHSLGKDTRGSMIDNRSQEHTLGCRRDVTAVIESPRDDPHGQTTTGSLPPPLYWVVMRWNQGKCLFSIDLEAEQPLLKALAPLLTNDTLQRFSWLSATFPRGQQFLMQFHFSLGKNWAEGIIPLSLGNREYSTSHAKECFSISTTWGRDHREGKKKKKKKNPHT